MFTKATGNLFSLFQINRPFANTAQLIEGLRNAQTDAIEFLIGKTAHLVRKAAKKYGFDDETASDLLNESLVILIEKIRDGSYNSEKSAPATYLTSICRNLIANHHRLKRAPEHSPIENDLYLADFSMTELFESNERCQVLERLLLQLGPPFANLIRLKYLEGYSDEAQINEHMTPYSTVESLRVMRSRGMKSLVILAEKWKSTHDAI